MTTRRTPATGRGCTTRRFAASASAGSANGSRRRRRAPLPFLDRGSSAMATSGALRPSLSCDQDFKAAPIAVGPRQELARTSPPPRPDLATSGGDTPPAADRPRISPPPAPPLVAPTWYVERGRER